MMPKSQLTKLLDELRSALQKMYGRRLINVILFGSQARHQAAADSDIDVLVVLDGNVSPIEEVHRTSEIVAKLSLKYDQVISCVFVSENEYQFERSPFIKNVKEEGIPV